jgi:hypothetical protein
MPRPAVFSSQSYADALSSSKASGKLLVLDATAVWCQPCQQMDRVTWTDTSVARWLAEHAVAVQIDVDAEKEVAQSLGIRAMPTVIAFRAGTELDRVVGMKKAGELVSWLEGLERGETHVDQLRKTVHANPKDMSARYSFARALASSGRNDDATNEYVWLWEHVTEHAPAMVVVRGSSMLMEIGRLTNEYPPARERFARLRDAMGDGVAATATSEQIADWVALTTTLGEADRVLAWFDANSGIVATRPDLEAILRLRLAPVLKERGRWADIAKLFVDPLATLRESCARLEQGRKMALPPEAEAMRPEMIQMLTAMIAEDAGLIVASLLAGGHDAEAREAVEEVRRANPGAETEEVLLDAAKNAGVDLP